MSLQAPPYFEGPSDAGELRDYLNVIIAYLQELEGNTNVGPYLVIAKNLSDLANVITARANLGLGSAATQNSSAFDPAGAAAAAQAASDPAGAAAAAQAASLQKTANLSDVASATTARANLGAAGSGSNADITALNDLTVRSISANDSVQQSDWTIEVDATSGPITLTFSPTAIPKKRVQIIKIDATGNDVMISDGTNVVAILIHQWQALNPYSNGTALRVPLTLA